MINSPTPNGKLKKSEKTDVYMYVIRICPDNKSTRVMNRDPGDRALESYFPEGLSSTRVPVFIGKNMPVFLFSELRTRRTIANSLQGAVQVLRALHLPLPPSSACAARPYKRGLIVEVVSVMPTMTAFIIHHYPGGNVPSSAVDASRLSLRNGSKVPSTTINIFT